MTYQIRPLFQEILQVVKKAGIPFDPLLPAQVKTITAVSRLHAHSNPFIGMAILPGRINVLLRPKTFLVKTLRLEAPAFITTYNVVVMDAAGDLRLVEEITANDTKAVIPTSIIDQIADLVEEQNAHNHCPSPICHATMKLLTAAASRIAHTDTSEWAGWILYILKALEDHAKPEDYDNMLSELSLAIEVRQLEGEW